MLDWYKNIQHKLDIMYNELPKKLSELIVEHFKQNFDKEGFAGVKWQKRKYDYKTKKYGPVLGGRTGTIGRNIEIIKAEYDDITVRVTGEAEEWAYVHNDGYPAHNMPQRKFMDIDDELENIIWHEINNALEKLNS